MTKQYFAQRGLFSSSNHLKPSSRTCKIQNNYVRDLIFLPCCSVSAPWRFGCKVQEQHFEGHIPPSGTRAISILRHVNGRKQTKMLTESGCMKKGHSGFSSYPLMNAQPSHISTWQDQAVPQIFVS
ncbi:hypothetical protein MJT46_018602 [Ovis ammon polii x Ovis aries]|nr:hypothetical protein MJT46_018602 [Ovis ammon polii x Ovis aries]